MKLIICKKCEDIVKLVHIWRRCMCGASAGHYLADNETAEVAGEAEPFGIGGGYFKVAYQEKAIFFGWFYGKLVPDWGHIIYVDMPPEKVFQLT